MRGHVTLSYVRTCYTELCEDMLHCVMQGHVTLYYARTCYTVLCEDMLHCIMRGHVTLCYVRTCYTVLCHMSFSGLFTCCVQYNKNKYTACCVRLMLRDNKHLSSSCNLEPVVDRLPSIIY